MDREEAPSRKRTRTGCWTCKESGYKCDEGKPACGRCVRLRLTCGGYGIKLKWQKFQPAKVAKIPTPSSELPTSSTASFSRRSESTISCASTDELAVSSTRNCIPSNLINSSGLPQDMTLGEYRLLHHWTSFLSTYLSPSPKTQINPFQAHLTPMAFQQGPLRYTVLSMAARHLATVIGVGSGMDLTAHQYQQEAIQSLSNTLSDPMEACSDSTLASVLLMQTSALFLADDEPRVNHLLGAKSIILRRGGPSSFLGSCSRFLFDLFTYHDVFFAVSRGERPLLDHDYSQASEADAFMHAAAPIMSIVSQISALNAWKETVGDLDDENLLAGLLSAGIPLESVLHTFKSQSNDFFWEQTVEAYRHAALIFLYRVLYNLGAPHPLTLQHVRRCLDALSSLPSHSPQASILVWPLFTAGCEALGVLDRQFALQRFDDMYMERRMQSLKRVKRAMQEVWTFKDHEAEMNTETICSADCLSIIKSGGKEIDVV